MDLGRLLRPLRYYRRRRVEPSWLEAALRGLLSVLFLPCIAQVTRLIAAHCRPNARLRDWRELAVRDTGRWLAVLCAVCAIEFFAVRWFVTKPTMQRPYRWRRQAVKLLLLGCQTWGIVAAIFWSIDAAAFIWPSVRNSEWEPAISSVVGFLLIFIPVLLLIKTSRAVACTIRAFPTPIHCWACGYDLRGLTETRCPECGLPFASQAGNCGRDEPEPYDERGEGCEPTVAVHTYEQEPQVRPIAVRNLTWPRTLRHAVVGALGTMLAITLALVSTGAVGTEPGLGDLLGKPSLLVLRLSGLFAATAMMYSGWKGLTTKWRPSLRSKDITVPTAPPDSAVGETPETKPDSGVNRMG